jgi:WD40 repeat protein
VATAGDDGVVNVWDGSSGSLSSSIATNAGPVSSLAWAPGGGRIVTGHGDGSVRIWEIASGVPLETLRGHQGTVSDLKWSPVDDRLASADGSGSVRIWNAASTTAWRLYPPQAERGGEWTVQGVDWSKDGRYLVVAGGDVVAGNVPPSLAIWDLQADELTMESLGDKLDLNGLSVAYSPDDAAFLYLGLNLFPDFSPLATAYAFDVKTGQIVQTFTPGGENLIRSAAWSPDGSQVATGLFDNQIIVWDYAAGAQITRLTHGEDTTMFVNGVQWSPDGSKLASASDDGTIRVWDAVTWEPLYTVHHEPPTFGWFADWSPDGKRLVSTAGNDERGAQDTTAKVWDGATGKELLVFAGHTMTVFNADWSPNGERVTTASNDGTARVWDAATGDELLTLSLPVGYGLMSWWSPDGRYLAIAGHETLISVWRVWQSTEDLIAYAKECCVFRELSGEELTQFGLR